MEVHTDMKLAEVRCIMFSLDLECAAIHMVPVQMQQEPLESSDDNDDKSVKALALEMEFKPQPDSPLLHLPGELRNKIYGYLYDGCTVQLARYERKVYTLYSCEHSALLQASRQVRKEVFSYLLEHVKSYYVKYHDLGGLCRRVEGADRIDTLAIDIRSCHMRGQPCNVEWMVKKLSPLCENGKLQKVMLIPDLTPSLHPIFLDLNHDLPGGPNGKRVRVQSVGITEEQEDEE